MSTSHLPVLQPHKLQPGDTIAIWSPSFPVGGMYEARFGRGVAQLEASGFRVKIAQSCSVPGGLTALPPLALADEFHALLDDDSVQAILAAVGGWTINTVLPHIDYSRVRRARKVIIGYSDISALLLAIYHRARLITCHGPALLPEWGEAGGVHAYTRQRFLEQVCEARPAGLLPEPSEWTDEFLAWGLDDIRPRKLRHSEGWRSLSDGSAEGVLIGGCIPTVDLLFGTPFFPDLSGAILFLEDEETTPDKLRSFLESFRQRGFFDRVNGLILGRISRPRAMLTAYKDLHEVVRLSTLGYSLPVAVDVDLGHTEPMVTLPVGTRARLDCRGGRAKIMLLEPAVQANLHAPDAAEH